MRRAVKEIQAWSRWLRPVLHHPPARRICWKVQDQFRVGLPDLCGHVQGAGYVIEHKHLPGYPSRDLTPLSVNVSPNQRAHLFEWGEPWAHVLLTIEPEDVLLLSPDVPVKLPRADVERYLRVCTTRHDLRPLVNYLRRQHR